MASLEIERARGRRHLTAVVRERLLEDRALGLLDEHAERNARPVEPGASFPGPAEAGPHVRRPMRRPA